MGFPWDRDALAAELAPAFHDDADGRTDAVVLGCTHYPLILDTLRVVAPWDVQWIDAGAAIARRALDLASGTSGESTAYVTGRGDAARYALTFAREGFGTTMELSLSHDSVE